MNFRFSHIYREGNRCADSLANYGIRGVDFIRWEGIPPSISYDYCRDRFRLPYFRFSSGFWLGAPPLCISFLLYMVPGMLKNTAYRANLVRIVAYTVML